jgi:NAD+ diphosphatase
MHNPTDPTTATHGGATLDDLAARSPAPFDLVQPLDRGHDLRINEAWLAARLTDPTTRFIPVWDLQHLVQTVVAGQPTQPAELAPADVADLLPSAESLTLLGVRDEHAYFTFVVPKQASESAPAAAPLAEHGRWVNLRNVADEVSPADWGVLTYSRALAFWHHRHRFCGECGYPTVTAAAGHVRRCTNPAGSHDHFPRTDPAIIVLVFSGHDPEARCLLGRQAIWPAGRFSTLAGFVEPGETVEQAVAREVHEEAGVHLREVRYYGSQSFPFPASLMLGYHAVAASEEIQRHDGELEDARWFTRRELRAALDAGTVHLPPRFAISHRLISAWFNAGDCGTL